MVGRVNVGGLDMSRFMLGTVQLGMDYGLGDDRFKPSREKAFALLDHAMECGVNALDTANNYGDSERVIGEWLARRRDMGLPCPYVVTKIGPFAHDSQDAMRDDILRQAEASRKTLGMETLDCLMAHNFADYEADPDCVRRVFDEMRRQNYFKLGAISAYSYHDYGAIADSGFDAVQIPINIFDWTQIENGGLERLRKSGMAVFARSVFLQGLVFQAPEKVDARMDFCVPPLKRFLALCEEFGLSPAVLAISFALSLPCVAAVVLGCQTPSQLSLNCEAIEGAVKLTQEQLEMIREAFHFIDARVINPGAWFNHT